MVYNMMREMHDVETDEGVIASYNVEQTDEHLTPEMEIQSKEKELTRKYEQLEREREAFREEKKRLTKRLDAKIDYEVAKWEYEKLTHEFRVHALFGVGMIMMGYVMFLLDKYL